MIKKQAGGIVFRYGQIFEYFFLIAQCFEYFEGIVKKKLDFLQKKFYHFTDLLSL